jgi:hypothetical protein
MQGSDYWTATTAEYGVGALTVDHSITINQPPPSTATVNSVLADLTPDVAAFDQNTVYMAVIPEQTSFVDDQLGPCCNAFDGFHEQANLGGTTVPFAIICTCPDFGAPPPNTTQDELGITVSHELVEAATDPFDGNGFNVVDDDHAVYGFLGGGELGDMCEFIGHVQVQPPGFALPVQRTWSNKAAKAGQDPCQPQPDNEVFFGSLPVLNDALSLPDGGGGTFNTKGRKLDADGTTTIDVQLFSAGPLEDWGVQVFDINAFFGGPPSAKFTLDTDHGNNGDVLHITVSDVQLDPQFGAGIFMVVSQYDDVDTLAIGLVAQ